ncbi:hypothetical protein GCM10007304_18270 [Rhodococcoides trifolii]|uniref:DUF3263 domain-containing protein n=2 Tax=Rhodococcoides trifolii TaxID=908250 RepID=A0A917FTU7_9NOCA|nr:hypothetical protein GCM10007304_18270 [Rhodococcus trifolii]
MLDFEKSYYHHAGSKEEQIRETFDLKPIRYYQLLNRLLDEPEAMAAEPLLVKRLRRLRDSRAQARRQRKEA